MRTAKQFCTKCKSEQDVTSFVQISCDMCNKVMPFDNIHVTFGYESEHDGLILDFCSAECLKLWLEKNT